MHEKEIPPASPALILEISDILYDALGIVRNETELQQALAQIEKLEEENGENVDALRRLQLAKMMLALAICRKESRGAHYRSDYPMRDKKYQRYLKCDSGGVRNELSNTD
jgi:aspartate oxidase